MRYLVAPYVTKSEPATPFGLVRSLSLCDLYPPQQPGQREPWQECEGPGDLALAWTELPTTGLTGVTVLPDYPVTARLRDMTPAEIKTFADVWDAQSLAQAARPGANATVGELHLSLVSGRRRERFDITTGRNVFDGPPQPQARPLPWQAQGGAFPTTSILDSFNRADENPITGWHIFSGTSNFIVSSNLLDIATTAANEVFGSNSYGPDVEEYITHTVAWASQNASNQSCLWARMTVESPITAYSYFIQGNTTPATASVRRTVTGTTTTLGSTFTATPVNGYRQGLEIIGTALTAYEDPATGTWTSVASRTDANIAAAGELALTWGRGAGSTTARADDFGGGTVVVGSSITRSSIRLLGRHRRR